MRLPWRPGTDENGTETELSKAIAINRDGEVTRRTDIRGIFEPVFGETWAEFEKRWNERYPGLDPDPLVWAGNEPDGAA